MYLFRPVLLDTAVCFYSQITFEAVRGAGVKGDTAIDDITFTDSVCSGKKYVHSWVWHQIVHSIKGEFSVNKLFYIFFNICLMFQKI